MPTLEQCAYAAGFMDGEGCIYIGGVHGRKPHRVMYAVRVGIGQDDIRPLLYIEGLWGGSINPGPVRSNGKCSSRWTVTAAKAAVFLVDILPYLIVKREQAKLALELQATKRRAGPWKPVDDAVIARWQEIKEGIATLNARYPGYYDQLNKQEAFTCL